MLDRWVPKGWPEDRGKNSGWARIDKRRQDSGGGLGRARARLERRRGATILKRQRRRGRDGVMMWW